MMLASSSSSSSRGPSGRGLVDLPRAGEPLRAGEEESMRAALVASEQAASGAALGHGYHGRARRRWREGLRRANGAAGRVVTMSVWCWTASSSRQ